MDDRSFHSLRRETIIRLSLFARQAGSLGRLTIDHLRPSSESCYGRTVVASAYSVVIFHLAYFLNISHSRSAFCAWSLFSAWVKIMSLYFSKTVIGNLLSTVCRQTVHDHDIFFRVF